MSSELLPEEIFIVRDGTRDDITLVTKIQAAMPRSARRGLRS